MSVLQTLLLLLSLIAGVLCRGRCPPGAWRPYGTHCYNALNVRLDFFSAREVCQAMGGDLVSIGDENENTFVGVTMSLKNYQAGRIFEMWTGYNNLIHAISYQWSDGTTSEGNYTNWASGYPGDDPRGVFMIIGDDMMDRHWATAAAQAQFPFMCKIAQDEPWN